MKNTIEKVSFKFALLWMAILSSVTSFAQEESASVYDNRTSKGLFNVYGGVFGYLLVITGIILIGYFAYRYWRDNLADEAPDTHVTEHHRPIDDIFS